MFSNDQPPEPTNYLSVQQVKVDNKADIRGILTLVK